MARKKYSGKKGPDKDIMRDARKIPPKWKRIIQDSPYKNNEIAEYLGMDIRKFCNYLYGLINLPLGFDDRIGSLIIKLTNREKLQINKKKEKKGLIAGIICNICGDQFHPWGGDILPICKRCYEVSEYVRKNKKIILRLLEKEINAIKFNKYRKYKDETIHNLSLYWEKDFEA